MSIEKLVQQLEHQPKTVEEHFAAKRDEWIADVAQLMSGVTAWLSPAIEKKLVRVERGEVDIDEQDTGRTAWPRSRSISESERSR